ncbi:transcriptional regulator with XRE-family HTH domain [Lipingzhangella halophila]|uniref:Transcriptional regulator with XRE-family HTH domain n=1 Tax=Lipingzhangella halophila TaxID=1783352 RepID=A0A7W7RG83_9ACTN|nr:helix-turn-helix transcriptional regulator [Lipingzhangella halophila]MBB4931419.1 transcriptional regulator with XRE-family HTH domain [Lipingzhangella halophila]
MAEEIRRYRKQRRLSVQRLADICTEDYALPIKRSVLANLESGRRPTLSVAELLVLARILEVPPLQLLFPIGQADEIEVLPGRTAKTWYAAQWFIGETPLDIDEAAAWATVNAAAYYRSHERRVHDWRLRKDEVESRQAKAAQAATESEREAHTSAAEAQQQLLSMDEDVLTRERARMRKLGITPPDLPDDLDHLEEKRREAKAAADVIKREMYPDSTESDTKGE